MIKILTSIMFTSLIFTADVLTLLMNWISACKSKINTSRKTQGICRMLSSFIPPLKNHCHTVVYWRFNLLLAAILSVTQQNIFTIHLETKPFTNVRLFSVMFSVIEANIVFFTLFLDFDKIKQNRNNNKGSIM